MIRGLVVVGCVVIAIAAIVMWYVRRGNPPSDARVVGFWELVGGDYPLINEYRADGMFVQHTTGGKVEPRPFRTEGGRIIVSITQPDGKVTTFTDRYEVSGNTLTLSETAVNGTSVDEGGSKTPKQVYRRTAAD